MTTAPPPHVLSLYPKTPAPPVLAHRADLDGITAYLLDDSATAARHGWFHADEIVSLWRPISPLLLPTVPVEVSAGMCADHDLISWRRMLRGVPIGSLTNVGNPALVAQGVPEHQCHVFGVLSDWSALPVLPNDGGPWRGHDVFRPLPELAPDALSDISNPLVEVLRLQAGIDATPGAKGHVHRVMRDGIAAWTPAAVDYFNEQVDHINAAIAAIIERKAS